MKRFLLNLLLTFPRLAWERNREGSAYRINKAEHCIKHFQPLPGNEEGRRNYQIGLAVCLFLVTLPKVAFSQSLLPPSSPPPLSPSSLRVVVNSSEDGAVQADDVVTLREAIALINGTLPLDNLSQSEKNQVQFLDGNATSRIEFNLPVGQNAIALQELLPPLTTPGLIIDGTTQPGYDSTKSPTAEISIPIPAVTITPASNTEVFRGLTVVADNITIRGLSLYGFTSYHGATASTPPADIFIASSDTNYERDRGTGGQGRQGDKGDSLETRGLLGDKGTPWRQGDEGTRGRGDKGTRRQGDSLGTRGQGDSLETREENNSSFSPSPSLPLSPSSSQAPKNVVIENNWLGIPPDASMPQTTSAFGVSVFNSVGTTIRRNRISYHDGSAIITGVRAEGMQVLENIIVGNGLAGMPDAIRLEGVIKRSLIRSNLLCANDGSGVFLFKPEGSVEIRNNNIKFNGRRFRRAAVYLMGNDHQVMDNQISYQTGAGVVVTSYPQSNGNIIQNNRFSNLEGLSIDLNYKHNVGVKDFQNGDGVNPKRNSDNRRFDSANAGINTPEFLAPEFLNRDSSIVGIDGIAEPGSQVDVYRVSGNESDRILNEALATTKADEKGRFSLDVPNLQPGDKISAIATHPKYGTSEPAYPAVIRSLGQGDSLETRGQGGQGGMGNFIPQCLTAPVAEVPPAPPEEPPVPPKSIRLQIPKNIHFALDKANISPASAKILDQIAQVLRDNPAIFAEMQGHTDPRASNAYNDDLAKRRALAARNYLMRQGIAPERLTIRAFGETQRLSDGNNIIDYARDRRVEFIYKDIRGIEVIVQETDLQPE